MMQKDILNGNTSHINTTDLSKNFKVIEVFFSKLHNKYCRMMDVLSLSYLCKETEKVSPYNGAILYIFAEDNTDRLLSYIELLFRHLEEEYSFLQLKVDSKEVLKQVIYQLNKGFEEFGVGYQYENGQIVRVDSQLLHAEVVKPALQLLSNEMYQGAQEEFLKAHEFYRKQDYKNMMVECLKAYESTLKIIMKKRGWAYADEDTANQLSGKIMQYELIPKYWQQYFSSLKNTLTAGLPTVRNKEGAHGQGEEIKTPPDYLASYVLHITASAIVFLAKAEEALD